MSDGELARAQARALRLLTARSRSEEELRRRLRQAGFAQDVAQEVIDWCRRLGYIDDVGFAEDWVEYRQLHGPCGVMRLRLELREKGVADSIIDDVLSRRQPPEKELELCLDVARGRMKRLARYEDDVRRRRLVAFLQRRGFRSEDIRHALNQVDTESDTV